MSLRTVKAGGLAGLLAGGLFIATTVIDQLAQVDFVYDSPNEYVFLAVITVAFLAVVGAVLGAPRMAPRIAEDLDHLRHHPVQSHDGRRTSRFDMSMLPALAGHPFRTCGTCSTTRFCSAVLFLRARVSLKRS